MIKNSLGIELPEKIGNYEVRPYKGINNNYYYKDKVKSNRCQNKVSSKSKIKKDIETAIQDIGLKDGMTISFHHSFREGDYVIGEVLKVIRKLEIKNLKFAPSAVVNINNPSIIDFVKDGTISSIEASGIRGDLGNGVIDGIMETPVILRPHGARPRAIEAGELKIDVAFIAASSSDDYGNCTGQIGKNICGSLGYSFIDARCADKVIVITDNIVEYPCVPSSIGQEFVDSVVKIDAIGDSEKIGAGAARITKNPRDLLIAEKAANVIGSSRLFKNGFSFQTGAGAISIACTNYLSNIMEERDIKASFALGGMTSNIIKMFDKGLIRTLQCSQSFDLIAAKAIYENRNIVEIDNSIYSNGFNKGCMLNKLNFGVLGALEIDLNFNINILTGSNGEMMGGLGGGPDVSEDADISIVTIPIVRGRIPSIVKNVNTICTPGETVAIIVTEAGIAINPKHKMYREIKEDLELNNIDVVSIEYLQKLAEEMVGIPKKIETTDKIVCIVEYRDGTVIDVIREKKYR